ncbi:kinase-like domain-containing protein [Rhizophagus irregularis DAOM 181602=DAOM 197198]|nr:kinase-like domain-containing protein [Rhizophagus irregularis DAOM 181602=DAOM 197198]
MQILLYYTTLCCAEEHAKEDAHHILLNVICIFNWIHFVSWLLFDSGFLLIISFYVSEIDEFIKETQLIAESYTENFLEWIPFDRFENIVRIRRI